jgi:hypothetical protein
MRQGLHSTPRKLQSYASHLAARVPRHHPLQACQNRTRSRWRLLRTRASVSESRATKPERRGGCRERRSKNRIATCNRRDAVTRTKGRQLGCRAEAGPCLHTKVSRPAAAMRQVCQGGNSLLPPRCIRRYKCCRPEGFPPPKLVRLGPRAEFDPLGPARAPVYRQADVPNK